MTKKQKYGMLAGDLLNLLLLLLNLRKLLLRKRSTRRFWTRKWLERRYFGRGSSLFFEELAVEDKRVSKILQECQQEFLTTC
jgi:hypothetical protein